MAIDGELIVDTKKQLKDATRGLILAQDSVLKKNLRDGTQILHSEEYPTQVFNLNDTKYIRINSADIEKMEDPDLVEDLLKVMLSIDTYSSEEDAEEVPEITDIIEGAVTHYKNNTGEDLQESELLDFDDFGNYLPDEDKLPLKIKMFKATGSTDPDEEDSDEKEELDEGDSISDAVKPLSDAMGMTGGDDTSKMQTFEAGAIEAELEVEQALEQVKHVENKSRFHSNKSVLKKEEIKDLNGLAKKLIKAFRGIGGKSLNMTPRKHISAKALATDKDRMYVKKREAKGKHIKMNIVVDMSGSMGGSPVKNAVSICYLFNRLAKEGFVTGSIFYSSCSERYKLKMPADESELLALNYTTTSEGLARTVEHYKEDLRHMNLICITDGDIVDEPIQKEFWAKNRITSTGVYVNSGVEDYLKYSGKMNKWFNHSLVRGSVEDLIQLLIRIGLKG